MSRMTVLALAFMGLMLTGCNKKQSPDTLADAMDADLIHLDDGSAVIVPEPIESAPLELTTFGAGTYEVQKGDTLWSIARRIYGDGQRWKDLAEANGITNPKILRVGQSLIVP